MPNDPVRVFAPLPPDGQMGKPPPEYSVTRSPAKPRRIYKDQSMPDDKMKTRPQDASRINIHEQYEVEYWTKQFGVAADQLRTAVAKVGTSATAVETELKRR
jgi:Protein of unknown function (DUF3606)